VVAEPPAPAPPLAVSSSSPLEQAMLVSVSAKMTPSASQRRPTGKEAIR
jgi:hypothetical protein